MIVLDVGDWPGLRQQALAPQEPAQALRADPWRAVARAAEAVRAERAELGEGQEGVLKEDPAGIESPPDRLGFLGRPGDDRGGEAERGVVGERDRLLGVGIGHDRDARAES